MKNIPARFSQKRIISASRRTDIPAFYSEWFMNRIRAGYCTVPNPYNRAQIATVNLRPEAVSVIVFWTRHPQPLFPYLNELKERGYPFYFLFTIIGYPREIDPRAPAMDSAVRDFKQLSQLIGKSKVLWRYDPILLSNLTPVEWHNQQITLLMEQLHAYTNKVVISLVEPYRKTCNRLGKETGPHFVLSPDVFKPAAYDPIMNWLAKEGARFGIKVQSCSEEVNWDENGITNGKCIDNELISELTGQPCPFTKDPSQRKLCQCVLSKDIGATNTCLFGCRYCYATVSMEAAENNFRSHDPRSPSLQGWYEPDPGLLKSGEDHEIQD